MDAKKHAEIPQASLHSFMKAMHLVKLWHILVVSAVLLVLHLYLSVVNQSLSWIAAYGADLIVLGILVIFSHSYPLEKVDELLSNWHKHTITIDPTESIPNAELIVGRETSRDVIRGKIEEINEKYLNILIYVAFTIVGTLLAGYIGIFSKAVFPSST